MLVVISYAPALCLSLKWTRLARFLPEHFSGLFLLCLGVDGMVTDVHALDGELCVIFCHSGMLTSFLVSFMPKDFKLDLILRDSVGQYLKES